MVLTVVDEMLPLIQRDVDQRELLAMAGMQLGNLLRTRPDLKRRELRRELELSLSDLYSMPALPENFHGKTIGCMETAEELRGSSILVVDDSGMARHQIQFFLTHAGYQVFQAKSGEEALWLVAEVEPDLILMDVSMDGISGLDACRQIKENPDNADLPIIFLSATGEREQVIRGFENGAVDYIVKPFHPAESLTRIQTHLRVRKLARQRQQNIQQLKQLNETKDRVLRMASHDLRSPISAIAGLAGFLSEGAASLNPSQREIISCIHDASQGVVNLLNELLDVSQFDAGQAGLKTSCFSPAELISKVLRLFQGEADRKMIAIDLIDQTHARPITADREQFRRVVDNLISNALKFTPPGGHVELEIDFPEADMFELKISDSGSGVPEGEQDRLFKEFSKTSTRPTGGERSVGLGLSIVAAIVAAHHGKISFHNRAGGGACFTVRLPAG